MRRVGRGGSTEIVVGPCDYSSPCSSAESNFRELDDVFLQTQTRIWLGEVLHVRFDEETTIADLLADGELLFQVSKVVWRMLLKRHAELKHSKLYIHERASFCKSGGRYMAYPKVDSFLRICQILGLTGIDLFSSSDVVEKKDTRRVCMCIRSLSKKARAKDLDVPDFDVVTYTIAMPTYMVGSIRRRLEQSLWSPTNSSGCSPCIDFKEIDRQRSLDSDFMWHHSPWSESDDAEESYREYELQSPASIASYDEVDISSLIGENFPGGGSAAEENIYHPSHNLFMLTWEQDEDVFSGVKSAKSYLETSVHLSHSNTRSNGSLQDTTICCCKSLQTCRTCQAHLDVRTPPSVEDISWSQTKINSGSEISKFDFDHSRIDNFSCRDLTSESDLCLTDDTKEERYVVGTSSPNDNIRKFLPESYEDVDFVKQEFSKATLVLPTSKKPLTCVTEDHDNVDSTYELLDEVTKEGRHVLEYDNALSECTSAGLLDSSCKKRHPELQCVNTERKVNWGNHNISVLSADNHASKSLMHESPALLSDDSNPILQNINSHCSVSIEMVADDQSRSDIEAFNLHSRCLENETACEVDDGEVLLTASQNSGSTICEDLLDAGGCVQLPGFQSPQKMSQMDLVDEIALKRLRGSVTKEESSTSTLNAASLNGNESDSVSNELCNQSVGTTDLHFSVCHESQASATDTDPHTSDLQSQDSNFLGVSCIASVSKEPSVCQLPVGCSKSNRNYPPGDINSNQFIDAIHCASDSPTDSGKQLKGILSCGDAFTSVEEQIRDFCAQLSDQPLSSDSFSRANDSPIDKELIFEKLVDEDGKTYSTAFEDMKQIPVDNFCINVVERQLRENVLCEPSASNEDTEDHQIATFDGTSCTHSVEELAVNNFWPEDFRKQTASSQQAITEWEGKAFIIETRKTCYSCCRISEEPDGISQDSFVDPCTGNRMNSCIKDKGQQGVGCTDICEAPEEKCLTNNETVPGSLYQEESLVSNPHLDTNHAESKGSEELRQGNIQKMDVNVSVTAGLPVVDFSEKQALVVTWQGHLEQPEACASKNEGLEMCLTSNQDCLHTGYLDTYVGSINLEKRSSLCSSSSDAPDHCSGASCTGCLESRSSCVSRKASPCTTICPLDMVNSVVQSNEVNNVQQPLVDDETNSMHHNDFACTETQKKDVEDSDLATTVRPDVRKTEEATRSEYKPAKKILWKSFAGGMTVLGALFLLLHFRRERNGRNIATSFVKLQTENASHERRPDKDKRSGLYPAEKLKF